jgi:flagella basal body P-ring formation protein FlgA
MKLWPVILLLIGLCAGALCREAAAAQQSAVRITLKGKAVVAGGVVELGEIATFEGQAPDEMVHLKLGNAPTPGQVRRVSLSLVRVRIASSSLDIQRCEFAGPDCCMVEVSGQRIEAEKIVEAARAHLAAQFAATGGVEAQIQLDNEVQPVVVPEGEGKIELSPSISGSAVPVGRTRVDVDILRDGARLQRAPVSFTVRLFDEVAVAGKRIDRGQPIAADNVSIVKRDVSAVRGACVTTLDELAGKKAACDIRAGEIVTRDAIGNVDKPFAVDYRQRVLLVAETDSLKVVTVGTSLSRARVGERARAKNESTGREVEGIAVADSTIKVVLEGSPRD